MRFRGMRTLIQNRDLKTLFTGVSGAAAAGLLMGAAMYPDLNEGAIKGPQILLSGGGPRAERTAGDPGLAAYAGKVPDYVVGTDWRKPPVELEVMAYEDRAEAYTGDVMAYEAPTVPVAARWEDGPREPSVYPSQQGNIATASDMPAPPAPPSYEDEEPA